MERVAVAVAEVEAVALKALVAHGATVANARPVAAALARAEAEGNAVCGLYYLSHFCAQLAAGKIAGGAVPRVEDPGAVVRVDAAEGFAHPAYEA